MSGIDYTTSELSCPTRADALVEGLLRSIARLVGTIERAIPTVVTVQVGTSK